MIDIHVCMAPSCVPIETLKAQITTIDGWKKTALSYNNIYNNYYDKSDEEREWVEDVRRLLNDNLPNEYKQGVHLLWPERGFMGEDVYVVDGNITTTIHRKHVKCNTYKIVSWNTFYCAHCQTNISRDEME